MSLASPKHRRVFTDLHLLWGRLQVRLDWVLE
jgi:hypothetical protein